MDENTLEELEQILYESDLGASQSAQITKDIRAHFKKNPHLTTQELLDVIEQDLQKQILPNPPIKEGHPTILLIVGVNGNGKTTSIAKLAHHYRSLGKSVLIAAADTYRAAATEQLEKWAPKNRCASCERADGQRPCRCLL